jgi:hypothetical protein
MAVPGSVSQGEQPKYHLRSMGMIVDAYIFSLV